MKVKDIRKFIYEVYTDTIFKFVDLENFVKQEIETKGIVVIDEIDKLVKTVIIILYLIFHFQNDGSSSGTKASDEGVQYDLLPLLDGTTITVDKSKSKSNAYPSILLIDKSIETRNILFVGAGAFEKVKPTDLIIEMQGRMPIQAKMEIMTKDDFVKILSSTKHNLLLQAIELLKVEKVNIVFDEEGISEIA